MHTDRSLTIALALAAAVLPALGFEREVSFDRTLTAAGPVELDVNTHSGRIVVRAGEGREVRIHGIVRANNSITGPVQGRMDEIVQNPPISQSGNVIRIDAIEDNALRRRLSVSYEITAPADARLRARTGSGAGTVEGLAGPVDVSTGSGAVAVTNIGAEARAHTGSGRIELAGIRGGVDVHTGSGAIDAAGIAGPIVARTGSGAIRLEQTAHAPVKAHTGSGQVTVRLPREGGFDLRGHTGSGSIQADQPVTVRGTIGGRDMKAALRGGGPLVDLSTGSGNIRIE
jgi:hypothetical protein